MSDAREEVAPGIFRLGNRFVNWWAVQDDDGVTLVDAGLPKHLGQLHDLLKGLGLAMEDVRAVLLTHADVDHIGVAEALRRDGRVPVYVHSSEERAATGEPRPIPAEFAKNLWRAWLRDTIAEYSRDGALEPEFLESVSLLRDGDVVDAPGRPSVIHCPGHTSGSCAFHLADRGVVFTGDALVTVDPATGERGPRLMPGFDNEDDAEALRSLDRLQATGAGVVLTGHGEPWTGGIAEAVATAFPPKD